MVLDLVIWIAIGLISGFVASKVINLKRDDPQVDLVVGVVSAIVAGVLCNVFSGVGVSGFTSWSYVVALAGAAVGLAGWHTARRLASGA